MLSAVAVLLLSGATIGYFSLINSRNAVNSVAKELRREIANRIEDHLRELLDEPQHVLRENALNIANGVLSGAAPATIRRHFLRQSLIHPSLTSIYFGNADGGLVVGGHDGHREVLYTIETEGFTAGTFNKYRADADGTRTQLMQSLPGYDARTRPWYQAAAATDGGVWGSIYILFTGQDMALPPSRAVRDSSGRLLGVVGGDIFVSQISRFLADLHRRAPGLTFIMEDDGELVATSNGEVPFTLAPDGRPGKRLKAGDSKSPLIAASAEMILADNGARATRGGDRSLTLDTAQGRHFIEVTPFTVDGGISWMIATIVPASHYMETIDAANRRTIALILLSVAVMAAVMWWLTRWSLRPLRMLTDSVDAIARGEQPHSVAIDRNDEIGTLARSFNAMSAAVRSHRETLRRTQDALESRVAMRTHDIRKLSMALEQSHNMVMITALDGTIEYVNPKFTELTLYPRDEAIGANPRLLKSGETPPHVYAEMWRTIIEGNEWRGELKDRRKDGTMFWASVLISPVKDETGAITNFVAMHEDVTHRHEAEAQVRQAKEQAEIANRAKSELMANMSHELRTPLNAVIGFSEVLLAETFGPLGNDRNREYVTDIHASGLHLLDLINDILDVSAIEAGKLELHDEDLEVGRTVEAVVRLISPRADAGKVGIRQDVAGGLPLLRADSRRFKQILLNLLSNAVKFTPEGGEITASVRPSPDGGVTVVVEDTGIGMTETEIAVAMTQFGQVDSGLNRKHEGTGLGLPLTHGLVALHGGTLDIASVKGRGTTVTIAFPPERSIAAA
ncbi:PAS domain-containing sensor histidine kinase [Magnetospirillum sp. SS-4]|uniref:sensor histidine kinase n=1 Tax=Magnetospirillum sp. SS-4 TaxID=2681465 RepID=UPI0015727884|nr:PAS domain-containing sensor histidine kinase [Magnetospirillum sp. SS-4]